MILSISIFNAENTICKLTLPRRLTENRGRSDMYRMYGNRTPTVGASRQCRSNCRGKAGFRQIFSFLGQIVTHIQR